MAYALKVILLLNEMKLPVLAQAINKSCYQGFPFQNNYFLLPHKITIRHYFEKKEYLFSGEHHETFVGFNSVTDEDHFKYKNWHIFKFFSSLSKVWIIEPVSELQ